jgi:UDP-GlcNAc:undecaprenyl-phosphate GlcNAc-1-phosphate transferase
MIKYTSFFLAPFLLSLAITPIIRFIAIKINLVSYPRSDRWHKKPTALLGGISIYLSSFIPFLFIGPRDKNVLGLILGATVLFLVGLADDKFHFTPYIKLFAQIISGCIAVFFGVILGLPLNIIFTIPLTILWIIGVTNSFNLLDNIDGLAAGVAAISSLMLFISSAILSNNPLGFFGLIICGAVLGFLPYNFHPAKIFMGDSGSMLLGYSLAVVAITGTSRQVSNLLITMIIPVLILSVPIFDTLFVMIGRKIQGRRIFEGGKDHTSHRLVTLGLSQRKTVLLLYAFSIIFGLIALSYSRLNIFIISIIAFLGAVILLVFGLFLFEVTSSDNHVKYQQKLKNAHNNTIFNSILLHKRRVVEVLVDLVMICIAYYSSYFLRFEGALLSSNLYLIRESLIWVIIIKMSVFFIFGLYRGVWRYVSIADMLTIFKVVSIGSVASILFLTFVFRFQEYSRAVFFLDWILMLFLVSGTRIAFRVLGEFFSQAREKGSNILVFGAGDTGEMVIREIKRNKELNYNPIGFIDDNLGKIGSKIQGVTVLGSRDDLKGLVEEYGIKEILIAIPSLDIAELAEIAKVCRDCGISYRKIKGILDSEARDEFSKN